MAGTELSQPVAVLATVGMLVTSNLFMTVAWYWHLKFQKPGAPQGPLIAIILVSWLIALVEYIIAVPANRIGAAAGLAAGSDAVILKNPQSAAAVSAMIKELI